MAIFFYNTATQRKEEFQPQEPGLVKMYACGPTVYDYFHIGNARAFIVFDTLRRWLEYRGYQVRYAQNITDVDDKIIRRAQAEQRTPAEVAEEFTAAFFEDVKALGCRPADFTPKATEHIPEIIQLVRRLEQAGHAYQVAGDVYFSVPGFSGYGRVSGKRAEDQESGSRVEVDARKQSPLDFALWKAAKPGEPFWDSPWGPGRPGWHIECSAMAMKYLGESFDIHGGGEDLAFPHHENENAQSESVTGKPLARYWIHNGFLKIDGEKMSKSLGNFTVTREILKHCLTPVLRLFMFSAHYRSPLDFQTENLIAAENGYHELQRTLERLGELLRLEVAEDFLWDDTAEALEKERVARAEKFDQAMDDDLNTAGALGQMHSLANQAQKTLAQRKLARTRRLYSVLAQCRDELQRMTGVLGISPAFAPVPSEVRERIRERRDARERKEFALSDRIRQELLAHQYELEDTVFGTLALRTAHKPFQEFLRPPNPENR